MLTKKNMTIQKIDTFISCKTEMDGEAVRAVLGIIHLILGMSQLGGCRKACSGEKMESPKLLLLYLISI